jgi:uncharacterized protein YqeY
VTDLRLKDQITEAMKNAMRAKEKERLGVIRLMLSECKRIEVDERIELDDTRVLAILDKMIKQRRDSAKQFTDAKRMDLADQENFEITVIQEFMPAALGEDEIMQLVEKAIVESGAENAREMGKVMALLKPQLQGRADIGVVSQIVKNKLQ